MNKRLTLALMATTLLLPYAVQAKPTWIVERTRPTQVSSQVGKQVECITYLSQFVAAVEQVESAATGEQKEMLAQFLQRAKTLKHQNRCMEVLAILEQAQPVLAAVQNQWLDLALEDLDRLFMGPSTVEQRAMLRSYIRDVEQHQQQGKLEDAIQLAQEAEDLFDNPPALTSNELHEARLNDAIEGMEILYDLALPMAEDDLQAQRYLDEVKENTLYKIYKVFQNKTLDDKAQVELYEQLLDKAETDLQGFLTHPAVPASLDKKSQH